VTFCASRSLKATVTPTVHPASSRHAKEFPMRRFAHLICWLVVCAMLASARPGAAQSTPSPALTEGPTNTSVGQNALASNTSGTFNTAAGADALASNLSGNANTATGFGALNRNTVGVANTAAGASALGLNVDGSSNTAIGDSALFQNASGASNVAIGNTALFASVGTGNTATGVAALQSATGDGNTALGLFAGMNATTGSHNIYLGANVAGVAADAHTMRLGLPFDQPSGTGQNRTFMAGVAGTVLANPAVPVFIDGNGQLGTLVPAPFSGSISAPVFGQPRPDAALARIDALEALVRRQQAAIAELQALVQRSLGAGGAVAGRRK
jgi:hypothetical protein